MQKKGRGMDQTPRKNISLFNKGKTKLQNSKVYLFKKMGEPGLNLTYKLSSFYTKQILTPGTLTKV